jgi:hypothetical protein
VQFRTRYCLIIALCIGSRSFAQQPQPTCDAWQPTFAAPGPDSIISAFLPFDDGSGPALYAGGYFRTLGLDRTERIARWNGAHWSPVGAGFPTVNGAYPSQVRCFAVFDDGAGPKLYAGGRFWTSGGPTPEFVFRWDGSSWTPLPGPALEGNVLNALASFDDGSGPALYAAGLLTQGGVPRRVMRWNGAVWSPVVAGLSDSTFTPMSFAVFDHGSGAELYLGGQSYAQGLVRWNGSTWTTLPSTGVSSIMTLTTCSIGGSTKLYAGGTFGNAQGGVQRFGVRRFDGSNWSNVGGGLSAPVGQPIVTSLAAHDFGSGARLVAAGSFTLTDTGTTHGLAAWDGTSWSPLSTGAETPEGVGALASFDDGNGRALYYSATFDQIGSIVAVNGARLRNGAWERLADGEGPGTVWGLHAFDDGSGPSLFACGGFIFTGGGIPDPFVARWDGANWHSLGGAVIGKPYTLFDFDEGFGRRLFALGDFTGIGGVPANFIARWDGSQWSPVGTGFTGGPGSTAFSSATFDDGSGPALYVGGLFDHAGGTPVNNISRWDGTNWLPLGSGTDWSVVDLAVFDDGTGNALYACGGFTAAGGVQARGIARWNGVIWSSVGANLTIGQTTYGLQVFDDGSGAKLYLCGDIAMQGSTVPSSIVRWDGMTWSPVGNQPLTEFKRMRIFDSGFGPRLAAMGADPADHYASRIWTWDGVQWTVLPGNMDGFNVNALETTDLEHDGAPDFYVGGQFRLANGVTSFNLAHFVVCGTQGGVACAGDGSGTVCPCGNFGTVGHGCANSVNVNGASLSSSGLASTSNDTLVLIGEGMSNGAALYFQGSSTVASGMGAAFGDGLRCAGGTVIRLGVRTNVNGASQYPTGMSPGLSIRGMNVAGDVRTYQTWYRNVASFCTPAPFNLSNGLQITWTM